MNILLQMMPLNDTSRIFSDLGLQASNFSAGLQVEIFVARFAAPTSARGEKVAGDSKDLDRVDHDRWSQYHWDDGNIIGVTIPTWHYFWLVNDDGYHYHYCY